MIRWNKTSNKIIVLDKFEHWPEQCASMWEVYQVVHPEWDVS